MRLDLDTNILLRIITRDDPRLAQAAVDLVAANDCRLGVLALAEAGYVLQSFYGASNADLALAARTLLAIPQLVVENEARVRDALVAVEQGMDWFDALLWAGTPQDAAIATFDRRFAKLAAKLELTPPVQLKLLAAAKKAQ